MNLTFDLPIVVGTHPRKARESRVREMARRGRDMARTRSVHSQPKQHGPHKEESETLLDLHKQYSQQLQTVAEDFDRIGFPWLNVRGSSPFPLCH